MTLNSLILYFKFYDILLSFFPLFFLFKTFTSSLHLRVTKSSLSGWYEPWPRYAERLQSQQHIFHLSTTSHSFSDPHFMKVYFLQPLNTQDCLTSRLVIVQVQVCVAPSESTRHHQTQHSVEQGILLVTLPFFTAPRKSQVTALFSLRLICALVRPFPR